MSKVHLTIDLIVDLVSEPVGFNYEEIEDAVADTLFLLGYRGNVECKESGNSVIIHNMQNDKESKGSVVKADLAAYIIKAIDVYYGILAKETPEFLAFLKRNKYLHGYLLNALIYDKCDLKLFEGSFTALTKYPDHLLDTFIWSETGEGEKYWKKAYKRWIDELQNKDEKR